jgi:hypothetical protein
MLLEVVGDAKVSRWTGLGKTGNRAGGNKRV